MIRTIKIYLAQRANDKALAEMKAGGLRELANYGRKNNALYRLKYPDSAMGGY